MYSLIHSIHESVGYSIFWLNRVVSRFSELMSQVVSQIEGPGEPIIQVASR